jgi:dipeptidase
MCDTVVALPGVTQNGNLLFAKNSDREPDEAQAVQFVPASDHPAGTVQCTYIAVPQVNHTYSCLLARPFQMWGAEMGVNEHGVAIGNEAVFTRLKIKRKNNGLTGMDMLRLALERSRTADEAVSLIIELLETYGQDACGGYRNKKFFYHNSFLIADAERALVLETADRHWAVEEVQSLRTLSNRLSVGVEAARLSAQCKAMALRNGWWKENNPFSFAEAYSDRLFTWFAGAKKRQACTTQMAMNKKGKLGAADCIQLLQTHAVPAAAFKPARATTASVCMHATGLLNPSETTGSMVAEIRRTGCHTVWLTATSNPCLSVYIPFFLPGTYTADVLHPSGTPDQSLWWKAEKLHRWIEKEYPKRKAIIEPGRMALQQIFLQEEAALMASPPQPDLLRQFTRSCLQRVEQWMAEIH